MIDRSQRQQPAPLRAAGRRGEVLVVTAIAVVALALTIASHQQGSVPLIGSLGIGGTAFGLLLLFHLAVRGKLHLRTLGRRVDRLEQRVAHIEPQALVVGPSDQAGRAVADEPPAYDAVGEEQQERAMDATAVAPEHAEALTPDAPEAPAPAPDANQVEAAGADDLAGLEAAPELLRQQAEIAQREPAVEPNVVDGLIRQLADELGARPAGDDAAALRNTLEPNEDAEAASPDQADDPAFVDMITTAARERRASLYLQPILTLPDRKVAHFDVLTKLRSPSDALIQPSEYEAVAGRAGVMPLIDQVMLTQSVGLVCKLAEKDQARPVFCRLSGRSIATSRFLRDFAAFMRPYKDAVAYIVLEIDEATLATVDEVAVADLVMLHRLGFRLSIGDVVAPKETLARLEQVPFDFMKVAAGTLRHVTGGALAASDLVEQARECGVALIVDDVGDDRALATASECGAPLAQGGLFSEPKPLYADEGRPESATAAA